MHYMFCRYSLVCFPRTPQDLQQNLLELLNFLGVFCFFNLRYLLFPRPSSRSTWFQFCLLLWDPCTLASLLYLTTPACAPMVSFILCSQYFTTDLNILPELFMGNGKYKRLCKFLLDIFLLTSTCLISDLPDNYIFNAVSQEFLPFTVIFC